MFGSRKFFFYEGKMDDHRLQPVLDTIGARAAAKKRAKKDKKRRAKEAEQALLADAGFAAAGDGGEVHAPPPPEHPPTSSIIPASAAAAATLSLPSWDRRMRVVEVKFFEGPAEGGGEQEPEDV